MGRTEETPGGNNYNPGGVDNLGEHLGVSGLHMLQGLMHLEQRQAEQRHAVPFRLVLQGVLCCPREGAHIFDGSADVGDAGVAAIAQIIH